MPFTSATASYEQPCAESLATSRGTAPGGTTTPLPPPIVLDIDGSVGTLPGATVLDFREWHERTRLACSMRTYREFGRAMNDALPAAHGTVFLGSGDFHHLSHALIARRCSERMFTVVVLDNHPDNMRFPFGIHCGSWVRRVAALPCVSHVHVLGITSTDVSAAHAWENYLTPLLRGKLTNWCVGVDVGWAARVGLDARFLAFDTTADLLDRFAETHGRARALAYLTIDKDVLGVDIARTNWDQGRMSDDEMLAAIALFRGRLLGSDVTGEVSAYYYRSMLKRWMSAIDRQPFVVGEQLAHWQYQQRELNLRLLEALQACDPPARH